MRKIQCLTGALSREIKRPELDVACSPVMPTLKANGAVLVLLLNVFMDAKFQIIFP
jgi:hypothetical protein